MTETFPTPDGTIVYTDTGSGPPVVFLHGNPTSAVLYRHLIEALAPSHRCIAPDYLGFGRSDKPASLPPDFSYLPSDHAVHIEALLQHLDLEDVTLVLHDWGGPIGLHYALRHPDRIRRLVLFNTWGWPHDRDPWIGTFSRLAGGPIGRIAIERFNAFARLIVPLAFADRSRLTSEAFHAYADPLDTPARRHPSWVFPRALLSETAWLRALWADRRTLSSTPALLCWGTRDPAFGGERYLRRWTAVFADCTVHRLPVGHYVPEEMGAELVPLVRSWMDGDRSAQ
jgi:haloalkane dehalogenase